MSMASMHETDHPLGDRLDELLHPAGPGQRAHARSATDGPVHGPSFASPRVRGGDSRGRAAPAAGGSGRGGGRLQDLEGPVGVHVHPHLALDDVEDA